MLRILSLASTSLIALSTLGGCGDSSPTAVPPVNNVFAFRQTWDLTVPGSGRYAGIDTVARRFTFVESESSIPANPASAAEATIFWRGRLSVLSISDSSHSYTGFVDTTMSFDGFTADSRGYTITRTFRVEVVDSAGTAVRARIYAQLAYDWKGSGGASTSTPTLFRTAD